MAACSALGACLGSTIDSLSSRMGAVKIVEAQRSLGAAHYGAIVDNVLAKLKPKFDAKVLADGADLALVEHLRKECYSHGATLDHVLSVDINAFANFCALRDDAEEHVLMQLLMAGWLEPHGHGK